MERESGLALLPLADRELAALGAGKVASDGEPEARTAACGSPGPGGAVRVGPVEVLEDAVEVLGGDARPVIRDGRLDAFVRSSALDGYVTSSACSL